MPPSTWVPLTVSIVALIGVLITLRQNGRHEARAWMREQKKEMYFNLLEQCDVVCANAMRIIQLSEPQEVEGELVHAHVDEVVDLRSEMVAAQRAMMTTSLMVETLGRPEIARIARKVFKRSARAVDQVLEWWEHPPDGRDYRLGTRRARLSNGVSPMLDDLKVWIRRDLQGKAAFWTRARRRLRRLIPQK